MVDKGKGFQIFAHILLSFLIICAIAPFILLIMSSITEEQTLITNGYSFFPEKFSTYAYEYLFTKSAAVFRGYAISFLVTAIGTVCNLLFTTLYAYPLSRKELPGRNIFAFIYSSPCFFPVVWFPHTLCGPKPSISATPYSPCLSPTC